MGANCRGINTADVRFSGLDDGTIARVSLKGFMAHKGRKGFILVRPLGEGKSLRLVGLVLLGVGLQGAESLACVSTD